MGTEAASTSETCTTPEIFVLIVPKLSPVSERIVRAVRHIESRSSVYFRSPQVTCNNRTVIDALRNVKTLPQSLVARNRATPMPVPTADSSNSRWPSTTSKSAVTWAITRPSSASNSSSTHDNGESEEFVAVSITF